MTTTLRQLATAGEIEYLLKHELVLPEHLNAETNDFITAQGIRLLRIDGGLIVAIYDAVEPNAWIDDDRPGDGYPGAPSWADLLVEHS